MRSLRSRLVVAFSLVAVVPLAVAMALLSRRIQDSVREQANDRLGATLEMLQAELGADGERLAAQLEILAADARLKRLYLLEPRGGPDLAEYLAEQRFLLGLDFLQIADSTGAVFADAAAAPAALGTRPHPVVRLAPSTRGAIGLVVEPLDRPPALAMSASAPVVYRSEIVGILRGGTLLDAARLARLKQSGGVDLVLRDGGGRLVATTLPGAVPPDTTSSLSRTVSLELGAEPRARITGLASTAAADRAIGALRATSLLLGGLGVAVAIVLGWLGSRWLSRPVERLARFAEKIARGEREEPIDRRSVRELETLVSALDRMRADLSASRDRLVASERQAALGQMARRVAHEVSNPLTPIAISIADLKRSYQQGRPDFPATLDQAARTIEEEIHSLKRLLREFAEYGRFPNPAPTSWPLSTLIAELETLYGRDLAEGRLAISRSAHDPIVHADRGQLRQALVNLIKNGFEAVNGDGRVTVAAEVAGSTLHLTVADTGPGLSAEQRAQLFVPGFTTKSEGSGLGLAIVERIVADHGGSISVDSETGRGATFTVRLPLTREVC